MSANDKLVIASYRRVILANILLASNILLLFHSPKDSFVSLHSMSKIFAILHSALHDN